MPSMLSNKRLLVPEQPLEWPGASPATKRLGQSSQELGRSNAQSHEFF